MRSTLPSGGLNDLTPQLVVRPQAPRRKSYNEKESAENLVKGIVDYNQLVLFVRNLNEFDTTSPDAKAFPEAHTEIGLPMVYVNGKNVGSYDTIKKRTETGP